MLNSCARQKEKKKKRKSPLNRSILVFQAVYYSPSVALHCIVICPNNLLKRGHGDIAKQTYTKAKNNECFESFKYHSLL